MDTWEIVFIVVIIFCLTTAGLGMYYYNVERSIQMDFVKSASCDELREYIIDGSGSVIKYAERRFLFDCVYNSEVLK